MRALFILFMTDFFLTYLGIRANVIFEGNPFMVWLFELPFIPALLVRLLMFILVGCLPNILIRKYPHKIRPKIMDLYYLVAYTANSAILGVHLYCIVSYAHML